MILKHGKYLLYFCHFIDDIYGIWMNNHTNEWDKFCKDLNNFGILTWKVEKLSHKLNFLPLTLTIENGWIVTKIFQKLMNLFLYLPLHLLTPQAVSRVLSTALLVNTMLRTPIKKSTFITSKHFVDL